MSPCLAPFTPRSPLGHSVIGFPATAFAATFQPTHGSLTFYLQVPACLAPAPRPIPDLGLFNPSKLCKYMIAHLAPDVKPCEAKNSRSALQGRRRPLPVVLSQAECTHSSRSASRGKLAKLVLKLACPSALCAIPATPGRLQKPCKGYSRYVQSIALRPQSAISHLRGRLPALRDAWPLRPIVTKPTKAGASAAAAGLPQTTTPGRCG